MRHPVTARRLRRQTGARRLAVALRSCTLTLAVLLIALPAAASADWPEFGYDLTNSRSAGSAGPTPVQAAALKQAWSFSSSNGDFTGTPVVAGGTLVAGTNLGSIFALDAANGNLRWSRNVGQQINGSAAIDLNAPGGATAFVPVGQVDRPHLLALSLATGAIRWDTVLSTQPGSDVYGSPVLWRGRLYIGTSGPGNDESTARGSVVSLDEASGRILWQTYTVPPGHDGGGVWSTPTVDTSSGRLYVGTGNAYHDPAADTTDSIMALSASDGQILGHFQSTPNDVWETSNPAAGPDYDFGASPNLLTDSHGRQLVGEGQKSGIYWALDRMTMKPVWHTSVGPGSQVDGGIGSTAYDGRRVYGSDSIDAQVFALSPDGPIVWNSSDTGTLHIAPVAIGNGVVYSADSDGMLTARNASNGAVLDKLPLGAPTFGGISISGRAVYVAVGTGPPSPALALPYSTTSQADGNGSIVAFGDPAAAAASDSGFGLRFSSGEPATPTGARLHAIVHRSSPNAKPSALRSEVLTLPAGSRFDGGALPACTASDQALQVEGPSACPASSRVGGGTIQVMLGTPLDPETTDVSIFNTGTGTVEVVADPNSGHTIALDRGTFTAPNQLTNHPPSAPGGPPDFRASVSEADLSYNLILAPSGRAFITTPPRCPSTRAWTSRVSYSTADGRSYTATATTPCVRPHGRHRRRAQRGHGRVHPRT